MSVIGGKADMPEGFIDVRFQPKAALDGGCAESQGRGALVSGRVQHRERGE